LQYLDDVVDFAKTIPNGTVDINSDTDECYLHKLALYERLLAGMERRVGGVHDYRMEAVELGVAKGMVDAQLHIVAVRPMYSPRCIGRSDNKEALASSNILPCLRFPFELGRREQKADRSVTGRRQHQDERPRLHQTDEI
jgi:hypothetical protein